MNKVTGKKVMMEKRRGSYLMKVEFVHQVKARMARWCGKRSARR